MVKRRRTRRFKLLVFAIVVAGTLGLAELLLGVMGLGFPRPYIPDEYIGTRLQPGFNAWFGKEGGAYLRVNSTGFRDSEHAAEKPAGEFRIAVLGDSYVEAAQVALEQTFWKQLQIRLNNESDAAQVSCLGFGVSGFGTAQELLTFRRYVKPLKPDVVVLAMTLANDIRNNSRKLEPVQERPFFALQDGQLVEDRGFLQHPAFLQAQESRTKFKTSVINASRLLQLAAELKSLRGTAAPNQPAERGLDDSIYRPPTSDEWQEAWQITEALILQLNTEVSAANATLVVVTLTDGMQVHPEQSVYDDFCRQIGSADLNYGDARIAELCRTHEIPVLNLAEPMRVKALSGQTWFHGFSNTQLGTGHWNADGHRVAGELLAAFLRDRVLQRSQNAQPQAP